ncbi:hypothetical protein D3C71_1792400 [compost metagenome]
MEITYDPSDAAGAAAISRQVARTSAVSAEGLKCVGNRGRRLFSSVIRKLMRASSSQAS